MLWNALAAGAVPRNPPFVGGAAGLRTDGAHAVADAPDARGTTGLPLTNVACICREGDILAADSLIVAKVLAARIHTKGVAIHDVAI
jgi:hypothetical protein